MLALPTFLNRAPLRCERELVAALGEPLLGTRPLRAELLPAIGEQLLAHWFGAGRRLLPIVSAKRGEGRSRFAAVLARLFARLGLPTLLIDADLRSPTVHRAFRLPNRGGLADLLDGRGVHFAQCGENLAVLVAGAARRDPLELLASERLPRLVAAAAKRFSVMLVDTPPAARGPDLQIFAALAGGALVLAGRSRDDAPALRKLRALLQFGNARVVTALTH